MLEQCSHYYDDQLKNNFDRLKIMLEPILIVSLGATIGVILSRNVFTCFQFRLKLLSIAIILTSGVYSINYQIYY